LVQIETNADPQHCKRERTQHIVGEIQLVPTLRDLCGEGHFDLGHGGEEEVSGDEGEGEVAHEGVDLRVENLLVQQVKVSEPLAALHNILQAAVSEFGRQIVLKHP